MPDLTDASIDAPSTGVPMPDLTDASIDAPSTGVPMPDLTDPSIDAPSTGVPMPDPTTESQREIMTDDEAVADTLRTLNPEDAARATLNGLACELGHDEVRVLTSIAERLRGGRVAYGPLMLSADPRHFRTKEAREEVEDALVYLACAWLQNQEVT
jgi:hypothetical protein